MSRFRDRYRIDSTRLQTWDYSQPGAYFITICTRDRQPYFGKIVDHKMQLSSAGVIVAEEWQRTEELRRSVTLDSWVVMPNHIHGVLCIDFALNRPIHVNPDERWKSGTLGAIINQFKGACTRRIRREVDPTFGWQSRFYEHIIRSDRSLDQIRTYIDGNPATWQGDSLFVP